MVSSIKSFVRTIIYCLKPILPYGAFEPWDGLDPRLYHAVHIYWLKFYGMWYNNFKKNDIFFWLQMIYTMIVLWLVCFLPCIGEVVYLLRRRENIGNIAEGLYLFLSEMYTYVKVAVFWLNKEKIMKLLNYLHSVEFKPTEVEHKDILLKSIKTARNVMSYYSAMCVGAVSVGIIIPLAEDFEILPTNVEYPFINVYKSPIYESLYIHHNILSTVGIIIPLAEDFEILPTNVEYPFINVYKSPIYESLYIHHIYYKPATCIIDGVMDTILAAFIASAIGQIDILAFNLRHFELLSQRRRVRDLETAHYNYNRPNNFNRIVLRDCVVHHNCIIRYVSMIEEAFSLASALQFMLSVMVLCLIGIQFLSIEDPMQHPIQMMWMAIYLSCMLTEVFILCWFGDELITKSQSLKQAAFDGPWIGLDRKTSMILVTFLERCQRPLRVTAGKNFTLSLDTYTVLINWAYKAFAVMRNAKIN